MVKRYQLVDAKVVEAGEGQQGQIIVYINPDEAEKKHLLEDYKLDEHTLNSTLDPDEISRLEFEPNHVAMIFKRPKNYSSKDHFLFKVASMGVFLFKDRLIVLLTDDIQLFTGRLFVRVTSLLDVALRLIGRTIYHFMEHLKVINMITDSLEQKINTAMENKYLLNLFTLEKSLVYYLAAINSNSMLIEKIKNSAAKLAMTPENLELIDDVTIESKQCARQAEIYSSILASLMDARASIVSNNINVLMKTLNIIMIGIMVPTLVVSIFSMNVDIPLNERSPFYFWFIIGLASISMVAFLFLWKRKSDRHFHSRS
ncbi:MAG: magnesium transporter CorA family protein [Verrucomicrobia bacterium]|nr:magnesium transporter CorA family protein [Verrucomicrobiota bacterium]MBU1735511.1 magnesium transporter CorA family protein [Verrucomicrobiota bacterium]MBU1856906.1 magnesium transporter CorA family protein [Verrucomicrobiota bacterium]